MLNKIKMLWYKFFIFPRYKSAAQAYGDMISYAYMGVPVGFDKCKAKIHKYMLKTSALGLKPWDQNEMSAVGWGKELPALVEFKDEEEKRQWWIEQALMDEDIELIQKTDLAQKILKM